jgi:TolB-like protein/DNA-binding winged helix-turn-helix (wHTH) protein/Flp pilus assembly protein TadD
MRDPESNEADGVAPRHEAKLLRFAGLVLDLDACMLQRESGEAIALTRGELALLRVFVTRPGRVLSRDMVLGALGDRRFEPFDRSVDQQVARLRRKIEPDPKAPRLIVTVPGEGYRFDGLAKASRSDPALPTTIAALHSEERPEKQGPKSRGPVQLHLLEIGTPAELKLSPSGALTPQQPTPPRLSIVVLPFDNIGGDPEQDYFTDGVTESLTTDLSRIRDSFVIARNTAFAYKGKHIDVRAIGNELNVRYALEGSVQRSGDRMRVSAQLIDAESGGHLWGERFDQAVAELFELQDAIVGRVAHMLNVQIVAAEARRAERRPTPDSMDLYFRGMEWLNRGVTPENIARARPFLGRAVALDPGNAYAIASEAITRALTALSFPSTDRVALLGDAEAAAAKALMIAPDHAPAHYAMGLILSFTNRAAHGVPALERALTLNRNFVVAHGVLGYAKVYLGRSEETETHIHHALRLSPHDPNAFMWMAVAGGAALHLGRDKAAVAWLRRSIDLYANFPLTHFLLAAALGNLGRLAEARKAVDTATALDPTLSIKRMRDHDYSDDAVYLKTRERIIEGLRKAGIPEA